MWKGDSRGIKRTKKSSGPTLKAIAEKLGVSVSTVSGVINGKVEECGISRRSGRSASSVAPGGGNVPASLKENRQSPYLAHAEAAIEHAVRFVPGSCAAFGRGLGRLASSQNWQITRFRVVVPLQPTTCEDHRSPLPDADVPLSWSRRMGMS